MGNPQKVWLDADTGNETDDAYAIVRLLLEPGIDVVGLSSAHFNNADLVAFEKWNQYSTKNIRTVEISQELNEEILRLMEKESIPHPIGADRQIGRAWGETDPRPSPASQLLIRTVQSLKPDESLDILCLGALTNIASAIIVEPTIASRIRCYLLGAIYHSPTEVWNKNDFNIRNDLNAFDYLLNNPSVDLKVMPTNVAWPFQFSKDYVFSEMKADISIQRFLKDRWIETNPDDEVRILWDLALVEAYLRPQNATMERVLTPPENTRRAIEAYVKIEAETMTIDFWQAIHQMAS